jgi:hypothetical protein
MKIPLTLLTLLLVFNLIAQNGNYMNVKRSTLELNFGYSQPLNYFGKGNSAANAGVNNFKFGYRYNLSRDLGIRGSFAFSQYSTESSERTVSRMTLYKIDAVYNLGKATGLLNWNDNMFTLLAYAGAGYGRHSNPTMMDTPAERMIPISIGLTPSFKVSPYTAIFFDMEFVNNYQQDLGFNGEFVDPSLGYEAKKIGRMMNFSLGIAVFLGGESTFPPADFR